jgi:hypothetical protein
MLLDSSCQAVTVGSPKKGFRSVQRAFGYRIIMNAYQHCSGPLPVGNINAIIQLHKVIVLANHDSPQAGTAQFVADPLGRIKSKVFFPQKNWRPSSARAAAILSTVTGVNDNGRKMSGARWQARTRRLRTTTKERERYHE